MSFIEILFIASTKPEEYELPFDRLITGVSPQNRTTSSSQKRQIESLLCPDEQIGKMAIRTPVAVEPDNRPSEFKVSWVVWMEVAIGVLRPDMLAKVKILS